MMSVYHFINRYIHSKYKHYAAGKIFVAATLYLHNKQQSSLTTAQYERYIKILQRATLS